MDSFPLVTVIILTYNSEEFVIETLESIKAQTYSNIELIISDDCSCDHTVDWCSEWIENNKEHFVNTLVLTVKANTGTAGNCNRALTKSKGKWLKFLGADDLLSPYAIENYIIFATLNFPIYALFAEDVHFTGNILEKKFSYDIWDLRYFAFRQNITSKGQYNILKKIYFGSGPTFFVAKEALMKVGGFDERFPLIEDYPIFLKLTKAGYKLYFMPYIAVYKRVHSGSVSHVSNNNSLYTNAVVLTVKQYKLLYKRENLGGFGRFLLNISLFLQNKVIDSGNSKKKIQSLFFYYLQRIIDPFVLYSRLLNIADRLQKYFMSKNNVIVL